MIVLDVDDKVNVKMHCVTNTDMFVFIVMDEELFSDAARPHKSFAQNWFFDDLCLISIRYILPATAFLVTTLCWWLQDSEWMQDSDKKIIIFVRDSYITNRKPNDNTNNLSPT